MKKVISLTLVLFILFAAFGTLVSCDKEEGGEETQSTAATCSHDYEDVVTPPTYKEKGYTTHTCKLCGDSYVDSYVDAIDAIVMQYDDFVTAIDGIEATSKTVTFEGDDCLEVATENKVTYFHAKGVGTVVVKDGEKSKTVVVEKAKLHFVVVMGQSNAGNHFANSTSDVTCPLGSAYFYSALKMTPKLYTDPSMGFHVPLIAELYAQSVAAGAPVKPVLIWNEGITSKDGQSMTAWAKSSVDSAGTTLAATMISNCEKYFTDKSDLYEIVHRGVFWLQGEADINMDPMLYIDRFECMWKKLKSVGMEYVAFMRVRRGVTQQGDDLFHNDIQYHSALSAQIDMVNKNKDMFMATTIMENWVGYEHYSHSVDINKYITLMEEYGSKEISRDSYGNYATIKDGILTTTMKSLFGSNNKCHYGKFGAAVIGADAAYNIYRALNGDKFAIVQADTSGVAATQVTSLPGETKSIDISSLNYDLSFRPSCDSIAGTLKVKVMADGKDVTSVVRIAASVNNYHAFSTEKLKAFNSATITVTYTPEGKEAGTVTYNIVK